MSLRQRNLILLFAGVILLASLGWIVSAWLSQPGLSDQELRHRVGQMLLVGFQGTDVSDTSAIALAVRELDLGGVFLMDAESSSGNSATGEVAGPEQVQRLVQELQRQAPTPLLVAAEITGGSDGAVPSGWGFPSVPSPAEMGRLGPSATEQAALILAKELASAGINLELAPTVDLNSGNASDAGLNPENFSNDPAQVSECARAFVQAMHSQDVITCLKLFPGKDGTKGESRGVILDITGSWLSSAWIPYSNLIKWELADTVMVGHLLNRDVDPTYPASLSEWYIMPSLRNELRFNGPVISNDLSTVLMPGQFSFEEQLVRAVNSGCDILLLIDPAATGDGRLPFRAAEALLQAVNKGNISQGRIWQASERVLQLKRDFSLLPPLVVSP